MKKSFFITLLFLFSLDFVFAQSYVSQVVLPKKIYVGDVAEIRVSFSSGIDFFADLPANQIERNLNLSNLAIDVDNDDFLLKNAILRRVDLTYTLVLFVVPWNTGEIKIPAINLTAGIYTDEKMPFVIPIEPFTVSSILTKGVESSMVPPVPPLLIPGTTYFLYGFIILFIVFLIFFFRLLFNWSKLVGKIKNYKLKKTYAQNKKFTLKQLKKLEKKYSKISDKEFCTELVLIIRNYLKVRYGQSFDSIPTSKLMKEFNKLTADTMSDSAIENVEELISVFYRADYIRFAAGSIDSKRLPVQEFSAELQEGEAKKLLNQIRKIINCFEGEVENA
ncbi:MAG: hypothetical protein IIW71_05075 [Treponema sp.]|nr:hypothetical protein [Treponema sp.]